MTPAERWEREQERDRVAQQIVAFDQALKDLQALGQKIHSFNTHQRNVLLLLQVDLEMDDTRPPQESIVIEQVVVGSL